MGYAQWQQTVEALSAYPGVEIFTIPHGRAAGELMTLFEAGELPDVNALVVVQTERSLWMRRAMPDRFSRIWEVPSGLAQFMAWTSRTTRLNDRT